MGQPPSNANVHSLTAATGASPPWSEWSTYESPILAGNSMPGLNPAATLAAYDVGPSDQHIFFRGIDDNLHETYYNGSWHDRILPATKNISDGLSGAGETAYWDGSNGHVFFVDQSHTINEFYWYNGNWWAGLSGQASAGFPASFLAGAESSIGGAHQSVYGSGPAGAIAEANCRSGSCWTLSNSVPPGGQVWSSPMLTFSSPTQELLFYVGGDNNVYSSQNATAINVSAGAPAVGQSGTPVHQSPLTGYWEPWFGYAFVYYVGAYHHVHKLYETSAAGPWYHTDMTTNAGCYAVGD